MSRWLILLPLVLAIANMAVAVDAEEVYPPPLAHAQESDAQAPPALPYPYQLAQRDRSADAYTQRIGYEMTADPAFSLAAIKAEAAGIVLKKIVWVVSHIAALAIGSLVTFGVCKLTPVCTYVAHRWYRSELPTKEEVRSLTKPAMSMLKAAISKYRSNYL